MLMRGLSNILIVSAVALPLGCTSAAEVITLDGQSLKIEQLLQLKDKQVQVALSKEAQKTIHASHELLIDSARKGTPVYGLTVGVGKNKDTPVFGKDGSLSAEARKLSEDFNRNMLFTHSAASGQPIAPETVKMAMTIRLNQIATGHVGVQPDVARIYQEFINEDIIPVVPEDGSVGLSDILLASHIGAAMMGEWDVFYKGLRMSAAKAMKQAGIKPLVPFGKDSLSILSNNALATAQVVNAIGDARQIIQFSPRLIAAALEGINGNISPLLPHTLAARPMPNVEKVGQEILANLEGGYLFQRDEKRSLQDALSYRGAHWPVAHAMSQLQQLETLVNIQINSSDDNPTVYINAKPGRYADAPQVAQYFTQGTVSGAINSSANFDTIQLASQTEAFINAMAQLGKYSSNRQIKLIDPYFTGLPRALVDPDDANGQAFYTLQNGFTALFVEIAHAANPVSFYGIANQGGIEDNFSNYFQAGKNLSKVVDGVARIYGFELMQVAQAMDLQKKVNHRQLSPQNEQLLKALRKQVAYYDKDRLFTPDVEASTQFLMKF
ncbi:phenylalanine ammonia-lyase [Shewanella algae]|nr:phenylalanine ammonia-lyase [Shewanella algae]TVL02764.1 phenylalanine ammonia-lyase [Shewanella algae]TVL54170.1 phenylalanine ammonia-lyase [Shewanella algae]